MKPLLLVNDSSTVRMDLRAELCAAGFFVTVCDTLAAARRVLRAQSFALVIVDALLPDGSGIDLIRDIRSSKDKGHTPVMLLSPELDVKHRRLGLSAGANVFVSKPFDRSYVVKCASDLTRDSDNRPSSSDRLACMKKKILVADGSESFLYRISRVIRQDHHDVVTVQTPEQALEILATEHIDCILLDLHIPGLGGAEMCKRIRRLPGCQRIPIMVLTGDDDEEGCTSCIVAGADEVVMKSPELDLLKVDLRALLRRRGCDEDSVTPSRRSRSSGSAWRTQTELPPDSLLYQVAQSSGLSGVIGPSTIIRACMRMHIDAKKMSPRELVRALPALRDALRTFFTPEETEQRIDALAKLARRASLAGEMHPHTH